MEESHGREPSDKPKVLRRMLWDDVLHEVGECSGEGKCALTLTHPLEPNMNPMYGESFARHSVKVLLSIRNRPMVGEKISWVVNPGRFKIFDRISRGLLLYPQVLSRDMFETALAGSHGNTSGGITVGKCTAFQHSPKFFEHALHS